MPILEKEVLLPEQELRELEKILVRTLPKSFENESITSTGIKDGQVIKGIGVIFRQNGFYFEAYGRAEGNSTNYHARIIVNLPVDLQEVAFAQLSLSSPAVYSILKN